VLLWLLMLPVASASASDVYYRTLMPPLMPPSPPAGNRPGVLNHLAGMHAGRVGRVRKMVIFSDEPRQATLMALQNPCLGVTMAGYALSAGKDAEQENLDTCVDLYFEGVAFSWNFLESPGAAARPEYSTAWQFYHESLARLISSAQRLGRLDPAKGLRVVTQTGVVTIPTAYDGFCWQAADFSRVEVYDASAPRKLKNHYTCPGLGVPLVVVRRNRPQERFLPDEIPFNATAILRPSMAALAGQAPPIGSASSHGPLEFYDPLRVTRVDFGNQCIDMATSTSAALEYGISQDNYSPWVGLVRPGSAEAGQEKLFLIEPYQPGKYPVIFVHGFFSSPKIWAHFANEILARPHLRNRIQLAAYQYPTGRPFLESAAILRRELMAMKEMYDPCGEDPGICNTALVGHSMGGLVCKLCATYSDDRLWYSVAKRPLTEISVSADGRRRLRDLFYFEPIPFVRRVVFMGAPHGGAQIASQTLGQWSASHVQQPSSERIAHDKLIRCNPGVFSSEVSYRIPTSIDLMEPESCLLKTIRVLCAGPNVQLHNIVGVGCISPFAGFGDGVVSRRSAQHHSVSSEKQIHTTHGGLHETDEAIRELECILKRHIWEANDVPTIDGYEIAVPQYETPVFVMPQCPEVCPENPCQDIPCPEIPCPPEMDSGPIGVENAPLFEALPSLDKEPTGPDGPKSILIPHQAPTDPATVSGVDGDKAEFDSGTHQLESDGPPEPQPEAEGPDFVFPEL